MFLLFREVCYYSTVYICLYVSIVMLLLPFNILVQPMKPFSKPFLTRIDINLVLNNFSRGSAQVQGK